MREVESAEVWSGQWREERWRGPSLKVQWLRLGVPNAGGMGLSSGWGSSKCHGVWPNIKQIKEVEREEGPGRVRLGPSTHVGEKEQDPSEERDDLAGQPQVVHRGAVRVWRLVGGGQGACKSSPSPSKSRCSPTAQTSGFRGASSLTPPPPGCGGHLPTLFQTFSSTSHRGPSCAPAPAALAVTHSALQRLVVGSEGKDDHGAQIGDHVDVEGDGPELPPLVSQ